MTLAYFFLTLEAISYRTVGTILIKYTEKSVQNLSQKASFLSWYAPLAEWRGQGAVTHNCSQKFILWQHAILAAHLHYI
jgi:hypothetical protein